MPIRTENLALPLLVATFTGVAAAQSPVHNGWAVAPFFRAATTQRVDVVCIGDSNQLHFAGGWDRAWTRALESRLGIYASGVQTPGEGQGNGGGVGEGWGTVATGPGLLQTSQAPPEIDRYLNAVNAGLGPLSYVYLAPGLVAPATVPHGMVLYIIAPLQVTEPLRFHFTYAEFDGDGPGSFQAVVRDDAAPNPILAGGPVLSTRSGIGGGTRVRSGFVELPAGPRPEQVSLRFAPGGGNITGPFAAFGMRAEQVSATHGAALHTLYGVGGQSSRDMAAALQACDDATLTLYFQQVRALNSRGVLIRVNTGLNDTIEPLPSVGPAHATPGSSSAAYRDNLSAIVSRVTEIWALNGWDERELYFVFTPSHALTDPDHPQLASYRQAARELSDVTPRCAMVDFYLLANAYQMLINNWFYASFDHNHLSFNGFTALSNRELDALIAASNCPADVDSSGGADGDDIIFFFDRWDQNRMDYTNDGGTDSDDVIAFFSDWDAGCNP